MTTNSLHAHVPGSRRWWAVAGLATAGFLAAPMTTAMAAAVCYKLPFKNPNLADGWGSLCCGRTSPHRGVDFPQASGTSIPAVADGKVVVNTYSSCLGNVVVLEHADGMYSGYAHLVSPSPLKKGAVVALGKSVGKVGDSGTCSNGAHLHLTMSPQVGGWASGTTVDPYKYIQSHLTCNTNPKGKLLSVDCEQIYGWTQDPDTPKEDISARLFFDGPSSDPDAAHKTLVADLESDLLCDAIDSCDHGFTMLAPYSLFDGADHDVYAYGIDSGTN
ncbi:MAG TPA: M23 family metallopeptidase, partial [Nannocystis sp.]